MKIGLIAMSGLRLCKPELLDLGFSFPSVARRAKEIEALPSLGLLTIAGLTPPGVDVEYLEVRDVDACDLPLHFDAVALSTLSATSAEAYRLAARFRKHGVPVILGGLHPTLVPEDAAPHVDSVIIGEGESVWPDIVDDLKKNRLKPRYDAREKGPFDFANAPMPRFELLQSGRPAGGSNGSSVTLADRYPRFTVQTQRGCPLSCEFCASSIRLAPRFKTKPVANVIAEIRRLKELYARPFIEFADDNTFVNKSHAKKLMRALEKEQVRWFTESDLGVADDEELLKMMRAAGCAQVLIGFENPGFDALDGVELNSNWKANRVDRYLRAVEKIQRHGITVNGCFVMGLDGSGPESFRDVYRFVRESGLYDVQITYLTPFPGTPLFHRLSEQGRILAEGAAETCTLFDINFQPQNMSVTQLEDGFIKLAAMLYRPEFVEERTRRFKSHLRNRIREERAKPPRAA